MKKVSIDCCFFLTIIFTMGQRASLGIEAKVYPEIAPRTDRPPTFDPLAGFANGRKQREMKVSWDEMNNWNLKQGERDYCAHHLIEFMRCQQSNAPFAGYRCAEARHHWDTCEYEDHLLRMKEFERERRLLKRRQRKMLAVGASETKE